MIENLVLGLVGGAFLGGLAGVPLGMAFYARKDSAWTIWRNALLMAVLAGAFALSGYMERGGSSKNSETTKSQEWFYFGKAFGMTLALTGWGVTLRRKNPAPEGTI